MKTEFSIDGTHGAKMRLLNEAIRKYDLQLDRDFASAFGDIFKRGREFEGCIVGSPYMGILIQDTRKSVHYDLGSDYQGALDAIGEFFGKHAGNACVLCCSSGTDGVVLPPDVLSDIGVRVSGAHLWKYKVNPGCGTPTPNEASHFLARLRAVGRVCEACLARVITAGQQETEKYGGYSFILKNLEKHVPDLPERLKRTGVE